MKNLILLIIAVGLFSCDDWFMYKGCKKMPPSDINSGEIIPNAIIPHTDVIALSLRTQEYVIKNDSQNVFNLKVSFDGGNTYQNIDFNQYTVLGKYASGGCIVKVERNVSKNDVDKEYLYKIKVHQCGKCKKYWESMNWVLVPRIPDDYTVSFVIEENKYK